VIRLDLFTELLELGHRLPGRLFYDVEVTAEEIAKVGTSLGRKGTQLFAEGTARDYVEMHRERLTIRAWGPMRPATELERSQMRLHLVDAAVGREVAV
jgi:hypothetical protein